MKLSVTINDTTHEVRVRPSEYVAFERQYGLEWSDVQEHPRMEHVLFLAHHASKREGITTDDFETWLDEVDELPESVEEAPLVPTGVSS